MLLHLQLLVNVESLLSFRRRPTPTQCPSHILASVDNTGSDILLTLFNLSPKKLRCNPFTPVVTAALTLQVRAVTFPPQRISFWCSNGRRCIFVEEMYVSTSCNFCTLCKLSLWTGTAGVFFVSCYTVQLPYILLFDFLCICCTYFSDSMHASRKICCRNVHPLQHRRAVLKRCFGEDSVILHTAA
jgi:hypothetical protein